MKGPSLSFSASSPPWHAGGTHRIPCSRDLLRCIWRDHWLLTALFQRHQCGQGVANNADGVINVTAIDAIGHLVCAAAAHSCGERIRQLPDDVDRVPFGGLERDRAGYD